MTGEGASGGSAGAFLCPECLTTGSSARCEKCGTPCRRVGADPSKDPTAEQEVPRKRKGKPPRAGAAAQQAPADRRGPVSADLPGNAGPGANPSRTPEPGDQPIAKPGGAIPGLSAEAQQRYSAGGAAWARSPWFIAAMVAAIGILCGAVVFKVVLSERRSDAKQAVKPSSDHTLKATQQTASAQDLASLQEAGQQAQGYAADAEEDLASLKISDDPAISDAAETLLRNNRAALNKIAKLADLPAAGVATPSELTAASREIRTLAENSAPMDKALRQAREQGIQPPRYASGKQLSTTAGKASAYLVEAAGKLRKYKQSESAYRAQVSAVERYANFLIQTADQYGKNLSELNAKEKQWAKNYERARPEPYSALEGAKGVRSTVQQELTTNAQAELEALSAISEELSSSAQEDSQTIAALLAAIASNEECKTQNKCTLSWVRVQQELQPYQPFKAQEEKSAALIEGIDARIDQAKDEDMPADAPKRPRL